MYAKITAEFEVEDENEYQNLMDMISMYGGQVTKDEVGD